MVDSIVLQWLVAPGGHINPPNSIPNYLALKLGARQVLILLLLIT